MLKKKVNINFLLALVLVAGLLMIPVVLGVAVNDMSGELDALESDISATLEEGEVDDVEGYGVLAEGTAYGLGTFANTMLIIVIIMVGGYAGLLFVFAAMARLIYAKEGKRLLAYRILMSVEYVLQAGIIVFLVNLLLGGFDIVFLLMILMIAAGLIYSARNTYTKRICG